jgi:hypothetical protein
MLKRIITVCVALLASTHTLALGQQSISGAREMPAVSLCDLTGNPDHYENKAVRVQVSLESVYLYQHVIGLILTSPHCESVVAQFERAEDEQMVIDAMRDGETEQAQVTVVGKLRGPRWPGDEFKNGLMGVLKYQLVIESVSTVKPLRKNP